MKLFNRGLFFILSIVMVTDGHQEENRAFVLDVNRQMGSLCNYLVDRKPERAKLAACSVVAKFETDSSTPGDSLYRLFLPKIRYYAFLATYDAIEDFKEHPDKKSAYANTIKLLEETDSIIYSARTGLKKSDFESVVELAQKFPKQSKRILAIAEESDKNKSSLNAFLMRFLIPDKEIIDSLYKAKQFAEKRLWSEAKKIYLDAVKTYANAHPISGHGEAKNLIEELSYLLTDQDSASIAGWNQSGIKEGMHRLQAGFKKGILDLVEVLSVVIQFIIPLLLILIVQVFRRQSFEFAEENDANSNNKDFDSAKKSLKTLIFSELQSLSDGPSQFHPHLVTGASFDAKTAITALPQAKILQALLTLFTLLGGFVVSKRNKISLCIHAKESGRGPGVTVMIRRNLWKENISESFWIDNYMPDFDKDKEISSEMVIVLSKAIATWIMYSIYEKEMKNQSPMGATKWKSYAYFMAGIHAFLQSRNDEAKKLYASAINEDQGSFGAWYNLGFLYTRDAAVESDPIKAKYHYNLAITALEKSRDLTALYDGKEDQSWRQIHYDSVFQLSAIHCYYINHGNKNGDESNGYLDELRKILANLKNESYKKIKFKGMNQNFREYINEFEKAAKCMTLQPQCFACIISAKLELSTPRAAYNSACCISENFIPPLKNCKDSCVNDKTNSAKMNNSINVPRKSDDETEWSALSYLDFALEMGGGIIDWAKKDPSLKNLRDRSRTEFDKLIHKHTKKEKPANKPEKKETSATAS